MNVQQARWSGKHRPDSHPVVRRASVMDRVRDIATGRLPAQQATFAAALTAGIERVALDFAELPDWPLTPHQRRLLQAIAAELARRLDA